MATKKKKTKAKAIEMTLWDVILSYPDLHDPKPYKGKIYYRTDVLMEKNDPQVKKLKEAIHSVYEQAFGEDESEWPEPQKPHLQNGDEREDSKGYAGRRYITASTQTPVPVVDPRGKAFNPQMVKGGMFANVAVRISSWEFDGDVGVSIYLQGVQIDTSKPSLNFGGGKSVDQMFKKKGKASEDEEEDEDEAPRKKSKRDFDEEEEEDLPKKKKKSRQEESEEEDAPLKKARKRDFDDEDEDEAPRKKKKKSSRDEEE